jgi:hypothetical protein
MGSFLRGRFPLTNEQTFVQGAGRILLAPTTNAWPDSIEDIIKLTDSPVGTLYDPLTNYMEVGFTKTGINITRTNAEEDFDVDQRQASIKRRPSNWEMSVGTQLAEAALETFALAWELPFNTDGTAKITTVSKTPPQLQERHIGLSAPRSYTERQVFVLFQFPDNTIRVWAFRRAVRAAQESGMTLQKTGEQVSLPMRWNCQVDTSAPEDTAFGEIFEQVPGP